LSEDHGTVDPASPTFDARAIPSRVGEALRKYLDKLSDRERAVDVGLLSALAYARGEGMDDGTWLGFAAEIGYRAEVIDLDVLRRSPAADYLLQTVFAGTAPPTTRLFHQALNDELLAQRPRASDERALVHSLLPTRNSDRRTRVSTHSSTHPATAGDWSLASPYARTHLAQHAAAAGMLDELLVDAGYLLWADRPGLVAVLDEARARDARLSAAAWGQVAHQAGEGWSPGSRAASLRLSALQVGADVLASRLAQPIADPGERAAGSWPRWCWWRSRQPTTILGRLSERAEFIVVFEDPRLGPVAALAMARYVEAWALETGQRLARSDLVSDHVVTSLASMEVGDRSLVAVGTRNGDVHVLQLPGLRSVAVRRQAHQRAVTCLCPVPDAYRPALASGSIDGGITIWTMPDLKLQATQSDTHRRVYCLARGTIGGDPVLISGGDSVADGQYYDEDTIRIWSLPDLRPQLGFGRDVSLVQCVVPLTIGGLEVLVTTSPMEICLWDLETRRLLTRVAEYTIGAPIALETDTGRLLLQFGDSVRRLRLTVSPTGDATAAKERPIETPPGKVTGPITVHGRDRLVSAGIELRLWDLDDIRASLDVAGASQGLWSTPAESEIIGVVATDNALVAVPRIGPLRRWRAHGEELEPWDAGKDVAAVTVAHLGGRSHVLIGYQHGLVRCLDAESLEEWPVHVRAGERLTALCMLPIPDRSLVAAAVDLAPSHELSQYRIRVWNLANGEELLSPDRRLLLRAWGWTDKPFKAVAYAVNEGGRTLLAAAGRISGIRVWDAVTFRPVHSIETGYVDVESLAIGTGTLAAGFVDGRVLLANVDTFATVADLISAHEGGVSAITFATWGATTTIVSGGEDGYVRAWTLTGLPHSELQVNAPVTCLATIGPDLLAIGTGRGVVVVSLEAQ
jgi:WD40 repeat protein